MTVIDQRRWQETAIVACAHIQAIAQILRDSHATSGDDYFTLKAAARICARLAGLGDPVIDQMFAEIDGSTKHLRLPK